MTKNELFLSVLSDLARSVDGRDEYLSMRCAGLLRLLLLDEQPLYQQVNRVHRLPVTFRIGLHLHAPGRPPMAYKPIAWAVEDGFDPEKCPPIVEFETVKLDRLLSAVVMVSGDHQHTIHDLIDHVSHIDGIIHAGAPSDDQERSLADLRQFMFIAGNPSGVRTIAAVGRVVLRALEPLRQAVELQVQAG